MQTDEPIDFKNLVSHGLYPRSEGAQMHPLWRFAFGMLLQALRDIVDQEEWTTDAIDWMTRATPQDEAASFEWCCGILEMDASIFRRWLRDMVDMDPRSKRLCRGAVKGIQMPRGG